MPAWDESLLFTIYDLAKSGMDSAKIARAIGVSETTFLRWRKDKPLVARALRCGKDVGEESGTETFREFVFKRLPPNLQELWTEIDECDGDEVNGYKRLQALLKDQGKQTRQHLFLYALVHSNFNASEACRKVGVGKQTLDRWSETDPDFKALVDEIHWHKANFFEGSLCRLVSQGDSAAVIFANKTYNRERGYNDKTEVSINHTGVVGVLPIDSLKLSLEARQEVLKALRAARDEAEDVQTVDAEVVDA